MASTIFPIIIRFRNTLRRIKYTVQQIIQFLFRFFTNGDLPPVLQSCGYYIVFWKCYTKCNTLRFVLLFCIVQSTAHTTGKMLRLFFWDRG